MQTAIKRETACWGEVKHRANLCSMESEVVWHRSNRDADADFIRTAGMDLRLDLDHDGNPGA